MLVIFLINYFKGLLMIDNILTIALLVIAFSPILLIMWLVELYDRNERTKRGIQDSIRVAKAQALHKGRK